MDSEPHPHIVAHDRHLTLFTASGTSFPIHPLWLRERCQHESQLDAHTQQRLFNPCRLDPDLSITDITQVESGIFQISFSDGITDRFTGESILAELACGPDDYLPPPLPWHAGVEMPPAFDWQQRQSDGWMRAALHNFVEHGYIILQHVPTQDGRVLEVARHFGFVRETNFGTMFDVKSVPDATDLAYTSLFLDPHTDNPYRTPVPGIQLLHCLINETECGLSTLVDGLAVAEHLRMEAPDAYALLCSVPVRFRYVDAHTELMASAALIETDARGRFLAINFSPRLDNPPLLPPDEMGQFYAARRLLDAHLASPAFERRFKLADGELMMFDNRRLLHGRTGYDPSTGHRHLQGCYIDLDSPRSLLRVLRREAA